MPDRLRIAILDDYQHVALRMADWSAIQACCDVEVFDRPLDLDAAAQALAGFDVLCHLRERMAMPRELIERLPRLKLITITGLVHRTLDLQAAAERGITVVHSVERPGSGRGTPERAAQCGARWASKEELFAAADFVSLHVVLGERTRGLVGGAELARMKPTAYLVNTARGPIVDEAALVSALRERRIAGAGLDVYDREPLPDDHPLRALPNALLTPHLGYCTVESYRGFYGDTVENIEAYLAGKPIRVVASASLRP